MYRVQYSSSIQSHHNVHYTTSLIPSCSKESSEVVVSVCVTAQASGHLRHLSFFFISYAPQGILWRSDRRTKLSDVVLLSYRPLPCPPHLSCCCGQYASGKAMQMQRCQSYQEGADFPAAVSKKRQDNLSEKINWVRTTCGVQHRADRLIAYLAPGSAAVYVYRGAYYQIKKRLFERYKETPASGLLGWSEHTSFGRVTYETYTAVQRSAILPHL